MGKETISRTTFAKGLTAGVVVAASLGILTVGEYTIGGGSDSRANGPASGAPESTASAALTERGTNSEGTAPVSASSYTPGTYTASAKGISSDVTVTAIFDENGITEITTDVSGETAGIGAEIGEPMIQKALEAQGSEIDGIAGATITSDAFKAALADCIVQASGAEATAETETLSEASESETDNITEVSEEETENVTEVSEEETENAAEVSYMSRETEPAPEESPDAPFVPGTYTAAAAGIDSDVTVTADFDENSILDINIDVSGEPAGFGAMIGGEMESRIMNAQSADVDGVSGATITSDAVISAFADCIAQAQGEEAVAVIGGADGPTSIFVAGKLNEGDESVAYMTKETEAALDESPEGPFTPGTYTATTAGIDSDIVVTMTFDATSILDMDIDISGEAAGIGAMIDDDMMNRILNAQSSEVDGVSGATVTSDAVKAAAADCIAQASKAESETEKESDTEMQTEPDTTEESDTEPASEKKA